MGMLMSKKTTAATDVGSRNRGCDTSSSTQQSQHPQAIAENGLQLIVTSLDSHMAITRLALRRSPSNQTKCFALKHAAPKNCQSGGRTTASGQLALLDLTSVNTFPDKMRRTEAADYCKAKSGVGSYSTLLTLACKGGGPRYEKVGGKVFYYKSDLDDWLASRTRMIDPSASSRNGGGDA
jgi:hypothetical protein